MYIFTGLVMQLLLFGQIGTVGNQIHPAKEYTLVFTEELRIGPHEDQDHYYWPGLGLTLSPGPNQHIYLCDPREGRILEFNKDGQFVRRVAGRGNGPGEIDQLVSFQVFPHGGAVMMDLQGQIARFQFFDSDMKYQRAISAQGKSIMPLSGHFSPDGKTISGHYINFDPEKGRVIHQWGVFSHEFQLIHLTAQGSLPIPRAELIGTPQGMTSFLSKYVSLSKTVKGFGVFDSDGNLYTASAKKYEITKWSGNPSKPKVKITRKYKPIPYTDRDIKGVIAETFDDFVEELPTRFKAMVTQSLVEKAMDSSDLGAAKVPIFGLIPIENTHFLVVHDQEFGSGTARGDIFTAEGVYLGSVETEEYALLNPQGAARMVFKGGKAYTILTDGDGENAIVRYAYGLVARNPKKP